MKKIINNFVALIIFFSMSNLLFAQAQLIESFVEINNEGNSAFGNSVSTAGDVNNDGYSDVIVGAPKYYYFHYIGRAYIFYGGSPMDSLADVILKGENIEDYFGSSVSTAGDVNGDGFDDIIVGAHGVSISGYDGKAYIYFGGNTMDNVPDVTLFGQHNYPEYENDRFAASVASAGDFNGDGYDDVIVGSSDYENNDISWKSLGGAHLYYGGRNMDATRDLLFVGKNNHDKFGCSVASAGDVNNDTYSDIIIGAKGANKAYVFLGGATPDTSADLVVTDDDNSNHAAFGESVSSARDVNGDNYDDVIVGNSHMTNAYIFYGGSTLDSLVDVTLSYPGGYFGSSVSTVGDVNNDGFDDVIVGDSYFNTHTGRAYIYLGGTPMNNVMDYVFIGDTTYNYFSESVAYAGDVNNDGYDDVIIGAWDNNDQTGASYIFYGSSSMDNTADVKSIGEGDYNYFGYSIASAGDVNGDNYPDIIVSAPNYEFGRGRAYIYFGGDTIDSSADLILTGLTETCHLGRSVSTAGDVNNDGYDDVIISAHGMEAALIYYGGSTMDTTYDVKLRSSSPVGFGWSVSTAGDVNGDNYDDVIVGTYSYSSGYANIYFGGSSMDYVADLHLTDATGKYFGKAVSYAGDVNNDGYSDVIVSGDEYGSNSNYGKVFVYLGGSSMDATADVSLTGFTGDDAFGRAISEAGDVNGDNYDDIIVGAYEGEKAYVYYGGNPMNTTADVTLVAENSGDDFGRVVSEAGDINNDGYADIIVVASSYYIDGNHPSVYKAYVYHGGSSMDTTPEYTFLDTTLYDEHARLSATGAGDFNGDGYDDYMLGNYTHPANGKVFVFSDNSAPLPVGLTSFTATTQSNGVILNWQTATEVNNYGFEIEAANDNDAFTKVGFVSGHGNSNSPNSYSFTATDGAKYYRLKQIDIDGGFEYSDAVEVETELSYKLSQNFPNPFNPSTIIEYSIPNSTNVRLSVYNSLGQKVATLLNKKQRAGKHEVQFDASNLSSGIYFYKLQSGKFVSTKKMILLR